jgi:hypothetical protein
MEALESTSESRVEEESVKVYVKLVGLENPLVPEKIGLVPVVRSKYMGERLLGRPLVPSYPTMSVAELMATLGAVAAAFQTLISPNPFRDPVVTVGVFQPFRSSSIYHWRLAALLNTVSVKFLIAILSPAVAVMLSDFIFDAEPMNPVESSSSTNSVWSAPVKILLSCNVR